jgi:hypothetical protein
VPVEVPTGAVVAHRGARVGVGAAICTSRRLTPASSTMVTNVWRSDLDLVALVDGPVDSGR